MNFLFFTLILVLCVFPKSICGRTNGGMFSLGMANAAIAVGAAAALTSLPQSMSEKSSWKPVRVKVPKALKSVFVSKQHKLSGLSTTSAKLSESSTRIIQTTGTRKSSINGIKEMTNSIKRKIDNTASAVVSRANILKRNKSITKPVKTPSVLATAGNEKKKLLILMSDTGGGHRASAQALDQALKEQFPGKIDVDIMDIWTEHAKYPFNNFVPVYRYLAKHPLLWRGFYLYGNFPPTKLFTETWSKKWCYKSFRNAIKSSNPDMVVSVHPLCQLMPISIIKEMNKNRDETKPKIPFITVVTDLGGAHSTWFDKRADMCFVPSDAVQDIALKNGISKDKLTQRGLPIRPKFWKRKSANAKYAYRKGLGLNKKDKTVLLMGGGDGVGGLEKIATEVANRLGQSSKSSQVVVICGNNEKIQNYLNAKKWPKNVKMHIKGFCNNIDEYMAASDCLVTKAGPGTIAEAMTNGLPMILSSFLPGQEAGNVPYVVDGGFGTYTGNKPKIIGDEVYKLFKNEQQLHEMSQKAKALARPDATVTIAKDIGIRLLQ
jgi:1,2-diacylglycerol 3-beta-galactosyltransferase